MRQDLVSPAQTDPFMVEIGLGTSSQRKRSTTLTNAIRLKRNFDRTSALLLLVTFRTGRLNRSDRLACFTFLTSYS